MRDQTLDQLTANARSLADQFGAETTETLIRAISGIERTATEGTTAVQKGQEAVVSGGQQLGGAISRGMQTMATPTPSTRLAWRAGRFVGRVEGAMRLAAFGVRLWRRQRQRGRNKQTGGQARQAWTHALVQWGPTVVATLSLAIQLGLRIRNKRGLART